MPSSPLSLYCCPVCKRDMGVKYETVWRRDANAYEHPLARPDTEEVGRCQYCHSFIAYDDANEPWYTLLINNWAGPGVTRK